jgi:REP element-mobilizing transposase RayT
MPRLPRIEVEGAIYYVTSRAVHNEEIFKDRDDYRMYLELVNKYKSQHKFRLFSYCLLPDRLELLIETGHDLPLGQAGASISEIMHDLNSLYTKHFNSRYQKRGHVFESRFRSVFVEKALHLAAMTRHIHQASANHEKTRSIALKEYPYSSFHLYLFNQDQTGTEDPARIDLSGEIKEVMSFLRARDDKASYEKYVLEGDSREIEALEKSLRRGQVLGSDEFKQIVKGSVEKYSEVQKQERVAGERNPVLLFFIGTFVVLAAGSSVYLYISKTNLKTHYEIQLQQKELEFFERTRFENRSPLELTDLEGTVWQIERISLPADKAKKSVPDTLHFQDGKVYSEDFIIKRGVTPTNISLTRQLNGVTTWETVQSNMNGDTVSWRGEWQGDAMKGLISVRPAGREAQEYSFYSVRWSYVAESNPVKSEGAER